MFGKRTGNTRTLKLPQNLRDFAVIVETALKEMSIDVDRSRLTVENGYGWRFQRGSVQVHIMLMQSEDRRYFQIYVPIVYLPQTGILPMYRRLLEYNLRLTGAALGVHNDIVYVFSERLLQSLEPEEVKMYISSVGEYADDLDNKLASEFSARMYLQA